MPLTLCTLNTKDLFLPEGAAAKAVFPAKSAQMARLARRAAADVLGLQEVGGEDAVVAYFGDAASELGYGRPIVGSRDPRGIGNALFSRLPVLASDVHGSPGVALPPFRRGDLLAPIVPMRRGVVHGVVDAGSLGVVHVLVCHLKSKHPVPLRDEAGVTLPPSSALARAEGHARSGMWRAAEALFVRRLVDDVLARDPGAHVAVLGDLNDTLGSEALRILCAEGRDASDPAPGALHACAERVPPERRRSVLHRGLPQAIDHVLVTRGLLERLSAATYLDDELRDHGPFDPGAPPTPDTDHAPFVVTFA